MLYRNFKLSWFQLNCEFYASNGNRCSINRNLMCINYLLHIAYLQILQHSSRPNKPELDATFSHNFSHPFAFFCSSSELFLSALVFFSPSFFSGFSVLTAAFLGANKGRKRNRKRWARVWWRAEMYCLLAQIKAQHFFWGGGRHF